MKMNEDYAGAVLDLCGGFFKHVRLKKGTYFKIRAHHQEKVKIVDDMLPVLKKHGIDFGVYKLGDGKIYQISNKDMIKKLKSFMRKYGRLKNGKRVASKRSKKQIKE